MPSHYCMHLNRAEIESQDFHNVCQSLTNLTRHHAIELGRELGLYQPTLDRMNDLPTEMVVAWMNRQDSVLHQSGEPTWKGLADALEKIGQAGVAQDIRTSNYCGSSAADTIARSIQRDISGPSLDHEIGICMLKLNAIMGE